MKGGQESACGRNRVSPSWAAVFVSTKRHTKGISTPIPKDSSLPNVQGATNLKAVSFREGQLSTLL